MQSVENEVQHYCNTKGTISKFLPQLYSIFGVYSCLDFDWKKSLTSKKNLPKITFQSIKIPKEPLKKNVFIFMLYTVNLMLNPSKPLFIWLLLYILDYLNYKIESSHQNRIVMKQLYSLSSPLIFIKDFWLSLYGRNFLP